MFHRFNWTRVVIIKKDDNLLDEKILPRYNIKVLATLTMKEDQIDYDKIYAFLEAAKRENKASVFIVDYLVHGTQVVMCAAGNLGMTLQKDYAFVLNPLIDPYWWVNSTTKHCPLNTTISKEFFIIKHDALSEHLDGYVRNNIVKFNYLAQITQNAIVYLGQSFKELLEAIPSAYFSLHEPPVSEKFVNLLSIQSQRMLGVKGTYHRRVFNKNHERQGIWKIQRVGYSHNYLVVQTLLSWNTDVGFEAKDGLPKMKTLVAIEMRMIPKDTNTESDCQVEMLRYLFGWSCKATQIFINLFCIAIFILILIVALMWYYRRQSVIMEDRYKKPFDDLCAELGDIDIRSSDVVISLQVGKGAFGIVYGGEAKRNTRWESVAIKLIKNEADYQGKIDFLTEAKLMRNLEHPNIVKLIGICLNPLKPAIYLVMELVVNGDLEEYLLTNRITANKDPNNKMVCPSLLTRFVSNIASGIEYLHKCSLLHRDLACRNCFLSEEYVVKIGDFGLTRNINESQINQYYRTSRHFVLPVRWMPPEAVQFGFFSVQSDIWSLGVVIFEVATFCSRPYFNFTDEDVPELVKRNTMPLVNYLPEEAKDSEVYKLIDRCCKYHREERYKTMTEIVEYLDHHSECIRPFITSNPPQAAYMGVGMNPYDIRQRPNSLASGGLNRFKSTSRSRTSVGNWGVFSDSHNNFDSILQTESDTGRVAFPGNPDQVQFIPNEAEFITIDQNTNGMGSKKKHKNSKKLSSNLNSSKSRSSDFMTNKIDDDQEPSYVSCPDQGNIHCIGDFDAQDFPYNDNSKPFIRSASGDEKSISSSKRRKTFKNGKVLYKGSSRNHKAKTMKYGATNKSKTRLNSSQMLANRKISEINGIRSELIQPLLFERTANVCIQPKRGKNFTNCSEDDIC